MVLTDRQRRVLVLLRTELTAQREYTHPARVARVLDGPGRSGAGWRSTLDALDRRGLVQGSYQHYGGGRCFKITPAGLEAIA